MYGHEYEWFRQGFQALVRALLKTQPWNRGTWQALNVARSPLHDTYELEDVTVFVSEVSEDESVLDQMIQPDSPWAEDHFQERVSGIPHNPAPSAARWPHAVRGNGDHTTDAGQYDHTYPERFWPRHAGACHSYVTLMSDGSPEPLAISDNFCGGRSGIRFAYGDLADVVKLLQRDPYTRQAYLPVWFPEDTGAHDGDGHPIRVPCTLGYHFMLTQDHKLNMRYYIRSCDVRRHLANDVYMACRLLQWVAMQLPITVKPGRMVMHIGSLHAFRADRAHLEGLL